MAMTLPVTPTACAATSASLSCPAVASTTVSPARSAHASTSLSSPLRCSVRTRSTPMPPCSFRSAPDESRNSCHAQVHGRQNMRRQ
eukprot:6205510-Pleurochrysis_carterae.AAC.1